MKIGEEWRITNKGKCYSERRNVASVIRRTVKDDVRLNK